MGGQGDRTKFVVGLGNPGLSYLASRHNVGFMVVAALCKRWNLGAPQKQFAGLLHDARVERPGGLSQRVMLLQPQTYMNCSGRAVRQMTDFYKAEVSDVLIVLDDMALPVGRLRARAEGSPGGHNGLADIVAVLGTNAVPRLRIGIGSPPGAADWKDYVLTSFRPDERLAIQDAIDQAAEAVEDWVFRGMSYVMERYNRDPGQGTRDQGSSNPKP